MEKKQPQEEADNEELVVLLRTLRVEATSETYFEERFLYEFHERLAHEAVSRPARVLLWEHLLQALTNFGRRRLIWGASSAGLGALCLGFFFSQQTRVSNNPSTPVALTAQSLMLKGATSSAEDAVRTTVYPRTTRRSFTESLLATRSGDTFSSSLNHGLTDEDSDHAATFFSEPALPSSVDFDASFPDLMLRIAH